MKITNQSTLKTKVVMPDMSETIAHMTSNESYVENMTTSFEKTKTSQSSFARPGDDVEINLTLTNNSEYEITDINLKDNLSSGATFKTGSLTIDDIPQSFDPIVGFTLPSSLQSNQTMVIKYLITINPDATESEIVSNTQITYSVDTVQNLIEDTTPLDIEIINNDIVVNKTSDKTAVIKGQSLTYIIEIKNEGNVTNTGLVFNDTLPADITFTPGTVKINDVVQPSANPNDGFSLPDLEANRQIVVKFDVTVN